MDESKQKTERREESAEPKIKNGGGSFPVKQQYLLVVGSRCFTTEFGRRESYNLLARRERRRKNEGYAEKVREIKEAILVFQNVSCW